MMAQENIFLFVPNIIDYTRIVLYACSFYLMGWQYPWAIVVYASALLLDEFDGRAARFFKQETRFGGLLDIVTDKCAVVGVHMVLCQLYPDYAILLQFNAILDVGSTWMLTHSSLLRKSGGDFKIIGKDENMFLHLFFSTQVLFYVIFYGVEIFYALMYIDYYAHHHIAGAGAVCVGLWYVAYAISGLCALAKLVIGVAKLLHASQQIADVDRAERKKRFSNSGTSKE